MRRILPFVLAFLMAGCANLTIQRDTQTSGTFVSRGQAFTFLSWDLPMSAMDIARENAADTRLTNMRVTKARVKPDLGWFDWLLDIIGWRVAEVRGTWGFSGAEEGEAAATPESTPGS